MENSLERINREMGAEIRCKYGIERGNDIIRTMAEIRDNCKYPLWGLNHEKDYPISTSQISSLEMAKKME